jgi:hypothetical protein
MGRRAFRGTTREEPKSTELIPATSGRGKTFQHMEDHIPSGQTAIEIRTVTYYATGARHNQHPSTILDVRLQTIETLPRRASKRQKNISVEPFELRSTRTRPIVKQEQSIETTTSHNRITIFFGRLRTSNAPNVTA